MLTEFAAGVQSRLGEAVNLELCFLEIAEPGFAARLEVAAKASEKPLLIFPFFLTNSGHAGEEIPEMAREALQSSARQWRIIDTSGWPSALAGNCERRLKEIGATPEDSIVVSGYGSSNHDDRWVELIQQIQLNTECFSGAAPWFWAPCGHFLPDDRQPLRDAVKRTDGEVAILPLFLGIASYQEKLIPEVISEFEDRHIKFAPTAILPDSGLQDWAAAQIKRELKS